jgi:GT2 family glycosyltransferase/glycosyltransferase involved in cell wall biosynthesis
MRNLLFIDDRVPVPSFGAGYPRANTILHAVEAAGWQTTLFATDRSCQTGDHAHTVLPESLKLAPSDRFSLAGFLHTNLPEFDALLVSRPHNMAALARSLGRFARHEEIPIIYDAEAIFADRDASLSRLRGRRVASNDYARWRELGLAAVASTVFCVSQPEADAFRAHGHKNVRILGHSLQPRPLGDGPEGRRNFLFVGALDDDHSPNVDSLHWFVKSVMPLIDREIGTDWHIDVVGRSGARTLQLIASSRIRIQGRIDDVDPYYAAARIFVAPTRFAAGLPMKVHEAASFGLPVVATGLLAKQLGWKDRVELMTAETAEEFAARCVELYRDDALWLGLRMNALKAIQTDCSPDAFRKTIDDALRASLDHAYEEPARRRFSIGKAGKEETTMIKEVLREFHGLKSAGRTEEAIEFLRSAVQDIPEDPDARMSLGFSLLEGRRYTEAYHHLRILLNLDPENAGAHTLIAIAALRLGAPNLALQHSQKALAASSLGSLAPIPGLAEALTALGETDTASKLIARLRNHKDYHEIANDLSTNLLLFTEDFENGLVLLARLCEIDTSRVVKRREFTKWFRMFNDKEPDRFVEFLESLGLGAVRSNPIPTTPPSDCSVDVIIPVHNALADLKSCLDSIRRWQEPFLGRIILVDDRSDIDTAEWLRQYAAKNADVCLLCNDENLGFTRTVARGIAESRSSTFVLLNSDTVVTLGWMGKLWAALWSDARIAMSGPLSNNAYFQSIIDTNSPAPDADVMAGMVTGISRRRYPRFIFPSGFCIMLRRDRYDEVGGLDAEGFPRGYFEVQDLALRFLDYDYLGCLADDAYVHHGSSSSIDAESKTQLTDAGRKLMFDRYGSIRVLAAEALCAIDEELAFIRGALNGLQRLHKKAAKHVAVRNTSVNCEWRSRLKVDAAGKDVCVFVAHAPHGAPLEFTIDYLKALRQEGVAILLCLVVEDTSIPISPAWSEQANAIVVRENGGFDFAAWADMLRLAPSLWDAKRLIFANDSLVGPIAPLMPILKAIRERDAGFFGLSECNTFGYHAQSFFFGWTSKNLAHPALRKFWNSVEILHDKRDVVLKYEYKIASLSNDLADPSKHIVFGMENLFGTSAEKLSGVNPTHHAWMRLLEAGFPFIKTDLLRDGVPAVDASNWRDVVMSMGVDPRAIDRHLEGSRLNRLGIAG